MRFDTDVGATRIVLAAALIIRIFIALSFPNVIAPDEVFQFFEQAHHLVFGQGIVPWEFQVGLRCWLIPIFFAGAMYVAHLVFQDPLAGLILIRLILCVASLLIVWCAAKWGQRFYGRPGIWIAGGLAALWPDLWLMAPHALEETLAADFLVPALYLIESPATRTNFRRIALAGFLLGFAFTLRIQLAPAIAVAGIALCRRDLGSWRVALLAGALPFVTAGMLDWYSWGQPFRSFWLNIYLNLVLGIAREEFGASPPTYFIFMLFLDWLWTLPVMLFLIWRGTRVVPVAGAAILLILATHSLISHKEFRFIFPAIALVIPLAGLGLSEVWKRLLIDDAFSMRRLCLTVFLLAGPMFSPWVYFMLEWQTNSFRAFEAVNKRNVSLVSVEGLNTSFLSSRVIFLPLDLLFPSSTKLTRQTIINGPSGIIEADAIVGFKNKTQIPETFQLDVCYPGNWIPFATKPPSQLCIWLRPAGEGLTKIALPFEFPFPPAAKHFIVKDRLMGDG